MSDRGKTYPVEYESPADEIEAVAEWLESHRDIHFPAGVDLRTVATRVRSQDASLRAEVRDLREALRGWVDMVQDHRFGAISAEENNLEFQERHAAVFAKTRAALKE